jgi:uncharacterized phage protein (TIGR01671 family)
MRDLKFRAWDSQNMFISPSLSDGSQYLGSWFEAHSILHSEFGKQNEIMQYTGLKDRNGNEIYEGDIIKRTQHIDGHFVDRIFETYEVSYNNEIAGFEYKPIENKHYKQYTVRPFGGEELEIIGNIHQNKELLTA